MTPLDLTPGVSSMPIAEGSAAAFGGLKLAAWGTATAATTAALAGDILYAVSIDPADIATRITVIGTAFLGLVGLGLNMWRDHLKKMQELRKGSLAEEVERQAVALDYYRKRDKDQDDTIAAKGQLIAEQNFELGKHAETVAKLREVVSEKDDTIKTLSLANLVARGYLSPGSLVIPSFLIPTAAHPDGPSPTPSGGIPIVTPEMAGTPGEDAP